MPGRRVTLCAVSLLCSSGCMRLWRTVRLLFCGGTLPSSLPSAPHSTRPPTQYSILRGRLWPQCTPAPETRSQRQVYRRYNSVKVVTTAIFVFFMSADSLGCKTSLFTSFESVGMEILCFHIGTESTQDAPTSRTIIL